MTLSELVRNEELYQRVMRIKESVPEFQKINTEHFSPQMIYIGENHRKVLDIPSSDIAQVHWEAPYLLGIWFSDEFFKLQIAESIEVIVHELFHVSIDQERHTKKFEAKVEALVNEVRKAAQI